MNDAYAPGAGSARDDDVKWNVVVDVDHAMLVAKRESSIWMIDDSAFDAAVAERDVIDSCLLRADIAGESPPADVRMLEILFGSSFEANDGEYGRDTFASNLHDEAVDGLADVRRTPRLRHDGAAAVNSRSISA
jgi:hypothetical protein